MPKHAEFCRRTKFLTDQAISRTYSGLADSSEAVAGEVRLLVVMRDRVIREALIEALSLRPDLTVCGNSGFFEPAAVQEYIEAQNADVVLLDLDTPVRSGMHCLRDLSQAHVAARILMTGLPHEDEVILEAIEAGAAGIATGQSSLCELVDNIHAVAAGRTLCSAHVTGLLFSRVASNHLSHATETTPRLTPREGQVVTLVERGLTNKAIARELCIEVQTVKNHVHNILEKLGLRRRTEVAHYARQAGWLTFSTGSSTPAGSTESSIPASRGTTSRIGKCTPEAHSVVPDSVLA